MCGPLGMQADLACRTGHIAWNSPTLSHASPVPGTCGFLQAGVILTWATLLPTRSSPLKPASVPDPSELVPGQGPPALGGWSPQDESESVQKQRKPLP